MAHVNNRISLLVAYKYVLNYLYLTSPKYNLLWIYELSSLPYLFYTRLVCFPLLRRFFFITTPSYDTYDIVYFKKTNYNNFMYQSKYFYTCDIRIEKIFPYF